MGVGWDVIKEMTICKSEIQFVKQVEILEDEIFELCRQT